MKLNRTNMTAGIAGLGLVGALVTGGVAAAQASTGEGTVPQPSSTTERMTGHIDAMLNATHIPGAGRGLGSGMGMHSGVETGTSTGMGMGMDL